MCCGNIERKLKSKRDCSLVSVWNGRQSFQILSIETEEYGNEIRAYELSLFKISDQKFLDKVERSPFNSIDLYCSAPQLNLFDYPLLRLIELKRRLKHII